MSYQDFLKFKKNYDENGLQKAVESIYPKQISKSQQQTHTPDMLDELTNKVVNRTNSTPFLPQYEPQLKAEFINRSQQPTTNYNYPQALDTLGAYSNNALNSTTLGLKPLIESKLGNPTINNLVQKVVQENPKAAIAGTLSGYLLPGMAIGKGVKAGIAGVESAVPLLGQLASKYLPATDLIGKIAKAGLYGAAEGGVMGAVEGTNEGLTNNLSPSDIAKNAATRAGEFGGMGLALGGAFEGLGGLGKNVYGNTIGFNKALQSTGDAIDNYKFPQLRENQTIPLPENNMKSVYDIPTQYNKPLPKLNEPLMLSTPNPMRNVAPEFRTEVAGDVNRPIRGQTQTNLNPIGTNLSPLNSRGNINSYMEEYKPFKTQNTSTTESIQPNLKNRQFIENSYMNSDVTTPKMKSEMRNKIPQYEEITNKETLDKANEIIGNDAEKHATEFLTSDKLNGAIDTAKGISLIQKLVQKGNSYLANEVSINLAEKLTKSGQEVQASSIMKRMTPEGMLQYANKTINKANTELANKAGNKPFEKIKLTPDETNFITNTMEQINKANNGELQLFDINLQLFAESKLAEVMKLISSKIPANLSEKLKSFQRINLLFNPKTMIRNLSGNIISSGTANTKDILATGIDKLVNKVTGKRTTLLPSLKTQFEGGKKGFNRVISDYKQGINTAPNGTQYEIDGRTISPFKNKPLKKLDELTRVGLRLGDDPFYQGVYDDILRREMKLKGVDIPTSKMISKADQIAKERTFQDTNKLSEAFSGLQKGLNKMGNYVTSKLGVDSPSFNLGNIVLPFVKTPANILARALEYSPLELTSTIKQLYNAVSKNGTFDQYKFVDSLAKSITGTALIGAGYELAKNGVITGASSKDKDARNFQTSVGILPYSFKAGDKIYSYDWAQPSSIPIAMGADIYYNLKQSKDPSNVLLESGKSGINTLFSQSLLQGLNKMFGGGGVSGGSDIASNLTNTALNATSQFIPIGSTLRQAGEVIDPYKRDTSDSSMLKSQVVNPFINTIPGLRQTLPAKINTVGEPVKANNFIDTFINPARSSAYNGNQTYDELLRLNSQGGENKQFPTTASSNISYKTSKNSEPQKLMLPPKEISNFQQQLGESNLQTIQKVINSPEYQQGNDKQKADLISNAMSKNKQLVENSFLKSQGVNEYQSTPSISRYKRKK